jgi:hypothetical protein
MPETCRVSWQNKILVTWCILLVIYTKITRIWLWGHASSVSCVICSATFKMSWLSYVIILSISRKKRILSWSRNLLCINILRNLRLGMTYTPCAFEYVLLSTSRSPNCPVLTNVNSRIVNCELNFSFTQSAMVYIILIPWVTVLEKL